ncbi:hypothetical protein [Estrella lausannensis]|uniref:Putative membrane protein n=1 Tax=Estrella lausannensis TaxID=483423 RepID=A0A0H5DPV1_9BACT|nr:hypothetical protein [Estrella lausannensis]CRX38606.1 putative membrane protein [Estrella lausannensis]
MTTQATGMSNSATCFQTLGNAANYMIEKGAEVVHYAQEPGVVQRTCQAGLRSMIGIYAVSQFPVSALVGAAFVQLKPEMAKTGISMIEGAISGIWTRMSFNQKVTVAAVGVASVSYFDPTFFFTAAGTVFSLKIGAEIGQRNLAREHLHEVQRAATENIDQVEQL